MKSLWNDYQAEVWDARTIEIEGGFISFQTFAEHIYIQELYVRPELRQHGIAARLADKVTQIALKEGKKHLTAKVDVEQKTVDVALKAQLAYGFVPFRAENGKIWLKKKIGGK